MAILIGALLALGAAAFAAIAGFDRSRAFYPMTLVVIASYYVLFAVMAGSERALAPEVAVFSAFAALAVLSFRLNLWLTVLALVAHAALDAMHGALIDNAGVPHWWPGFCLAYDLIAAGCLAALILRQERSPPVV